LSGPEINAIRDIKAVVVGTIIDPILLVLQGMYVSRNQGAPPTPGNAYLIPPAYARNLQIVQMDINVIIRRRLVCLPPPAMRLTHANRPTFALAALVLPREFPGKATLTLGGLLRAELKLMT
jgi:hypothetical protein